MKKVKYKHAEIGRMSILCVKEHYSFICPHTSGFVDEANRRISQIVFCRNGDCEDYEPINR